MEQLRIDQYAYLNKLRHVHPAEKFFFALATMIICLALATPVVSFFIILLMTFLVIWRAKIPALFYLKLLLIPIFFLVVGVPTVALSFGAKDTLIFLWGFKMGNYTIGVTKAGVTAALELFLKSLGAVSCLYFFSLTTPMVEILMLLRKLRLPSLFVELMSLVYRFIFVLLQRASEIYLSQATRWGYATVKNSYYSLGQLGVNLFTKSYVYSQMLFTTLLARGYQGDLTVLEETYSLSGKNIFLIAITEMALLAVSLWFRGDFNLKG